MKPIHFESFRLGFFFIFFSLFFILFLHLFLTVCQFSDLLTLIHFLNFFSYQTNFQILNAYFFLFFFSFSGQLSRLLVSIFFSTPFNISSPYFQIPTYSYWSCISKHMILSGKIFIWNKKNLLWFYLKTLVQIYFFF